MMCLLFLPVLWLPVMQKHFHSLQAPVLVGVFDQTKKPTFWPNKWLSGEYQSAQEKFLKDKNPILKFSIRAIAQWDYEVFGDIMHEDALFGSGEKLNLFTETNCKSAVGIDYLGKHWLEERIKKLSFIIRFFEKEDIPFLVLTPPTKATVFPELMPEFYRDYPVDSTNYETAISLYKDYDIPYIDFSHFIDLKKNAPYDLYAQAGIHWTNYGSTIAVDTIIKYIEKRLDISMVRLSYDVVEMTPARVNFDNEIAAGANFFQPLPLDDMPYPIIDFVQTENTECPNILSVGDSFYLLIYKYGIPQQIFSDDSRFWYYGFNIMPEQFVDGKKIFSVHQDVMEEIRKRDLVILTIYENNLERFAFDFVDRVYEAINKEEELKITDKSTD